ncbi:MAG: type II toxin-antitoxin system VapC family toxin [SAR324 cluster bacterium]|nr:type II toxin-antitoxin system VapC family toxin [SAR324 cluster bacterium]
MLLDSNIIIYAIQPEFSRLRQWIANNELAISEISLLEVLGYHKLTQQDKLDLTELFDWNRVLPVSRRVIDFAITLRQQRKMSLGDALIAATAMIHDLTLVTRNTKDFEWIQNLKLLNPFEQE